MTKKNNILDEIREQRERLESDTTPITTTEVDKASGSFRKAYWTTEPDRRNYTDLPEVHFKNGSVPVTSSNSWLDRAIAWLMTR